MKNNNDHPLKKLLQSVELDEPTSAFTELVIKDIIVEMQQEEVIEMALKSLLQPTFVETPSLNFTENIMVQVKSTDRKIVYEPISKRAWQLIGAAVLFLVILGNFFPHKSSTTAAVSTNLTSFGNKISSIFAEIHTLPPLYFSCLMALSCLLFIDYFLKYYQKIKI